MAGTELRARHGRGEFSLSTMMKQWIIGALSVLVRLRARIVGPRVIVYYRYPLFVRKAEALSDELRRHGFRSEVRAGTSPWTRALLRADADLWIGFWNGVPVAWLPTRYIFINAEPLNLPIWFEDQRFMAAMKGALEVWGYRQKDEQFVRRLGLPFHFYPMGYSSYYE